MDASDEQTSLERELDTAETLSLWLWVLGQAGLLALFTGRIKLTSGYPEPTEATADLALACGQLVLASLLAHRLLGRWPATGRALAAAVVFATLAGLLAGRPLADALRLNAVTGLWLLAIGRLTRTPAGRLTAVFLTIAAPVLYYARREFGPATPELGNASTWASPTLGIGTTVLHHALFGPILPPILILMAVIGVRIWRKWRVLLRPLHLP